MQRVNAANISSEDKISAIRDLKVTKLNQWVNENIGDLNVMSGDYEIRSLEGILNGNVDKTKEDINKLVVAQELLNRNLRNYSRYSQVFIVNSKTGLIELSTDKKNVGRDESDHTYFNKVINTRKLFIEEIHFSIHNNEPHLTFSKPIMCLEIGRAHV